MVFSFLLSMGLRKGECLGLGWQDVDLERGTITIRQTVVTLDGKPHIQEPKSAAARRKVKLPLETVSVIQEHRVTQIEHRLQVDELWADKNLIFPTELGGILHPSNVNCALVRPAVKARVPRIAVHELRHTHAIWPLAHGQPIKTVQDRMGHAKASITLDTYAHIIPGMQEEAAAMVSELLGRGNA